MSLSMSIMTKGVFIIYCYRQLTNNKLFMCMWCMVYQVGLKFTIRD